MPTVRRHPVPPESYEPDRPLNDLGRDQFEHFKHVAERLPLKARGQLPAVPSPEDGMAASQFIAAVTRQLLSRKRPALKLVSKPAKRAASESKLALAAAADDPNNSQPIPKRKKKSPSKSAPESASV